MKTQMSADKIQDILDRLDILKKDIRVARKDLENELEKTDVYRTVFEQSMKCSGNVEVSEKDAHKHALNISLKHFSN